MHTQSRRSYGLARSVGVLLVLAVLAVLAGCGSNTGSSVALGASHVGQALSAAEEAEVRAILQTPASALASVEDLARRATDPGAKIPLRLAALRGLEKAATPTSVSTLKALALDAGADPGRRLVSDSALACLVRTDSIEARDALGAVLQGGPLARRILALKLLGHSGRASQRSLLGPALTDPDPAVRAWAQAAQARLEAR